MGFLVLKDLLLYLLQLVQALRYETLSSEEEKLTENTVDNLLEESIENQNSDTPPTQGSSKFNVLSLYVLYMLWLSSVREHWFNCYVVQTL